MFNIKKKNPQHILKHAACVIIANNGYEGVNIINIQKDIIYKSLLNVCFTIISILHCSDLNIVPLTNNIT